MRIEDLARIIDEIDAGSDIEEVDFHQALLDDHEADRMGTYPGTSRLDFRVPNGTRSVVPGKGKRLTSAQQNANAARETAAHMRRTAHERHHIGRP